MTQVIVILQGKLGGWKGGHHSSCDLFGQGVSGTQPEASRSPPPSSLDITSPRPLLLWWQRRQCLIHGSALTCSKLKLLDWMVCACKHRTLKNWNGCSRKHWTTLEAGDTLITSPVQGWQSTSFRNVFDLHCLIYRKWKLSHCFCRKTELEILSHCTKLRLDFGQRGGKKKSTHWYNDYSIKNITDGNLADAKTMRNLGGDMMHRTVTLQRILVRHLFINQSLQWRLRQYLNATCILRPSAND